MLPPIQLLLDQLLRCLNELSPMKLRRLVHLVQQSQITVLYIEVRKEPMYGTWDSYIEGSTTSYDASRYRYGTGSST